MLYFIVTETSFVQDFHSTDELDGDATVCCFVAKHWCFSIVLVLIYHSAVTSHKTIILCLSWCFTFESNLLLLLSGTCSHFWLEPKGEGSKLLQRSNYSDS